MYHSKFKKEQNAIFGEEKIKCYNDDACRARTELFS